MEQERERKDSGDKPKKPLEGMEGRGGATPKKKVTLLHSLHAPIRNTGRAQLPALRMSSASSARFFYLILVFFFIFHSFLPVVGFCR